jgi:hypothetical protein
MCTRMCMFLSREWERERRCRCQKCVWVASLQYMLQNYTMRDGSIHSWYIPFSMHGRNVACSVLHFNGPRNRVIFNGPRNRVIFKLFPHFIQLSRCTPESHIVGWLCLRVLEKLILVRLVKKLWFIGPKILQGYRDYTGPYPAPVLTWSRLHCLSDSILKHPRTLICLEFIFEQNFGVMATPKYIVYDVYWPKKLTPTNVVLGKSAKLYGNRSSD